MDRAVIIDDDPLFAKALKHKLSFTYGFEVESFKSAERTLNSLKSDPDIIFLDYQLSVGTEVMDGLMALRVLKKNYPKCTIIMMSGVENTHWLKQGQKYGASTFITKSDNKLSNLEKVITEFRINKAKG
ncbi:MAG: response regulator [Cytophagales bacterium]